MVSAGRFDPGVFERLDLEAREYSAIKWTESEKNYYFENMPVPQAFPHIALYETFASTAVFIAHEQTGNLLVDEKIALEAIDKVKYFCNTQGLGSLVYTYRLLEKGKHVCSNYSLEERIISLPAQLIRGIVP